MERRDDAYARLSSYVTSDGTKRDVIAVNVDGVWTVIDVRSDTAADDGDRDERIVEGGVARMDEVTALVNDYTSQATAAGGPQVKAA